VALTLWLARHGATDWSDAGRLCGWADVPLNAAGRRQARALRARLAGRRFASVLASDLSRAAETAAIAIGGAVPDPRLRELHFGELEGRTWAELDPGARAGLLAFEGFRAPGGESVEDLRRRVLAVVHALPPGEHLLVTHGGVIRLLLGPAGASTRVAPGGLVRLSPAPAGG
jgi:probable phosphoglycerate mutase